MEYEHVKGMLMAARAAYEASGNGKERFPLSQLDEALHRVKRMVRRPSLVREEEENCDLLFACALYIAYDCRGQQLPDAAGFFQALAKLRRWRFMSKHGEDPVLRGIHRWLEARGEMRVDLLKEAPYWEAVVYAALCGMHLGLDGLPSFVPERVREPWSEILESIVRKKTIAIVSPGSFSVPPVTGSSVEHDIEMVARELKKRHRVIVYARRCPDYPNSETEGNLAYRRFRYEKASRYLRAVIRDLKRRAPDIVQVENRPRYVHAIKRALPDVPVILSMHSMQFASEPLIGRKQANRAMEEIDALFVNSRFLKQRYEETFPCLKGKACAVHLGIERSPYEKAAAQTEDLEKIKRKLGVKERDRVLLFVGRVKKEKGVHHIMRALPTLVRHEPDIKLLIVGSPRYGKHTNTSYWRHLRAIARRYRKHVRLTRFIKPKYVPYLYQVADLVLTPSVWEEPFCRVNLEAMASGLPVITTNRGGIPEVVKDGENGYVIPLDFLSRQLPQRVLQLLHSEETRRQMQRANRERALQFSWAKTVQAYERTYHQIWTKER